MKLGLCLIGYNRKEGIARLLKSLENANYYGDNVDLIISLDNPGNFNLYDFANNYEWKFGQKKVRFFSERQGLKKHILSCGEFLQEYDAIAVFEDDLIVSPSFYKYMKEAVDFYKDEPYIGGISLYSYQFNVNRRLPFIPSKGNSDVYFMQYAQSWGQIWLKNSFLKFLEWIKNEDIEFTDTTPDFVNSWPDKSSWLKFHIKYCVDNNLYFVYPYTSFTTCFSDVGEHADEKHCLQQVTLVEKNDFSTFKFEKMNTESIKYDVFFERILNEKDILIDLYGTKQKLYVKYKYVLSTNILDYKVVSSYALELKPHELNYLFDIKGNDIYLYDTSIIEKHKKIKINYVQRNEYYCLFDSSLKNIKNTFNQKAKSKIKHLIKK